MLRAIMDKSTQHEGTVGKCKQGRGILRIKTNVRC